MQKKLTEIYSSLFVLGTSFREQQELGSPDVLRTRLLTMFHNTEREGKEAGYSMETLSQAQYALAAFIDEMLFTSNWTAKEQWASRPLQFEFFGEYVAGEGFFKKIDVIRGRMPLDTELLEVYVHCLILGFEGQYRVHEREKLRGLIEDVTREIQAKREPVPFAPHGQRPEEFLETVKRGLPAWVVVVIGLGIIFFVYIGLTWLIKQDAHQVAKKLEQLNSEVQN